VIFGQENVTTGASNDFMQVSRVARQMVERFGFSKKIGQVAIGGPGGNPFLGQQVGFVLEVLLPSPFISFLVFTISNSSTTRTLD
jgi:ATP-dependent Zn protease